VRDKDKPESKDVARDLLVLGFNLYATRGTAKVLQDAGIQCTQVNKVLEGQPHIVDMIKNDEIRMIVNTTEGKLAIGDSYTIRRAALQYKVTYTTTMAGARATIMALKESDTNEVNRLQDLHKE
jgi:carbamoyl-phosphate synthase large subunit